MYKYFDDHGHKFAVPFLSDIVNHPEVEYGIKIAAATALAPYQTPKWQPTPTPRYIETPIDLPEPTTVEQATQQIALLGSLLAKGEIDLDFQQALVASRRAWIESKTNSDLESRIVALELNHATGPIIDPDPSPPADRPQPDPNDPRSWGVT
jgi:hypothetical protein